MGDKNLYTRSLSNKYARYGYNTLDIRQKLQPYMDYLQRVKIYYENKGFVLEYRQHKIQGDAGCSIELIDLDERKHRQLFAMDVDRVYEHDPARSTSRPDKEHQIRIQDRNAKEETLLLERRPQTPQLMVHYNTYQIYVQYRAVASLVHYPLPEHIGLLRLVGGDLAWPAAHEGEVDEWFILTKDLDGVLEQRQFVKIALGTPDFAFLEGPPGSGKTTVLAELVMQLVSRGKRVLFCASTHVAVDNLLERIAGMDGGLPADLIPLRIGSMDNLSEEAKPFQYDQYLRTIRNRLDSHLSGLEQPSESQKALLELLRRHDDTIGRIARECANLVCGTTIGILQYPGIKDNTDRFDYMIIDEASKTTFQEFLVTAVFADRWILVGDTNQLSPYTDDEEIAMQVDSCVGNELLKTACMDVFAAKKFGERVVVATRQEEIKDMYEKQCKKLGVSLRDADGPGTTTDSNLERVVVGSPKSILKIPPPKQKCIIRNGKQLMAPALKKGQRAPSASKWTKRKHSNRKYSWSEQVGWRIRTRFPIDTEDENAERVKNEIQDLMPGEDLGYSAASEKIDEIRAIALPSILESLRGGAGIIQGIPEDDFGDRHVLLSWQYRMHPDIASFSHSHVYGGNALNTPRSMAVERDWQYGRYGRRAVWIDVDGRVDERGRSYSNEGEAERITEEVRAFCGYARANPKTDGTPWTVAVLSFYGGQIPVLQKQMRRLAGHGSGHRFKISMDGAEIHVDIHTVDRFQGHEADVVFLSMVRDRPTIFLNHINRINVAITRARYQCVIVGNLRAMKTFPPLGALAREMPVYMRGRRDHG